MEKATSSVKDAKRKNDYGLGRRGRRFQNLCRFAQFTALAALLFSSSCVLAQSKTAISHGVKLIERTVATGVTEQPEIQLILRLPDGHTPENPTVKGVLAFCTWQSESDSLRTRLTNNSDEMVRFARKRGLALLTWNTATLWKTGRSYNQVDRQTQKGLRDDFDRVARAWENGVRKLCREQGLPQEDFLLYGISRGAHWGGRLALRIPRMFLAVNIHVANSYDRPVSSAAQPLWLVSSGDLDRGRDNALVFYRECRGKGFPMIVKVINGLGHADHRDAIALRMEFFDYALRVKERASNENISPAQRMLADLAEAELAGDVLSQEVYRGVDGLKVPEVQRVALPDEKLAKVWGFLRK